MHAQTENEKLLLGKISNSQEILSIGETWQKNYKSFEVSDNLKRAIQIQKSELSVVVVFGSWCEDSENWVPSLLKLFDETQFPNNQTTLVAVDRTKKSDLVGFSDWKIELLPTFIFYRNGQEIGRFVESPKTTFENDLVGILKID